MVTEKRIVIWLKYLVVILFIHVYSSLKSKTKINIDGFLYESFIINTKGLVMKSNLYNSNNYQNCTHSHQNDLIFDFRSTEQEIEYTGELASDNLIILFLKGSIKITSRYFHNRLINEPEMIVLPYGDNYIIKTSKNTNLLFFRSKNPNSNCAKQVLNSYKYVMHKKHYNGYLLIIKNPINEYIKLLRMYILAGIKCDYLSKIKPDA